MTPDTLKAWLESTWGAHAWEHLPGYSRAEVEARRDRYLKLDKAGPGLGPSFDAYHDQVLMPWIGSEFFRTRPRVGVFLREFPLPCLDRTKGLLSGHEGKAPLPAEVMAESVREVLSGNRAYRTVQWALEGAHQVLSSVFNLDVEFVEFVNRIHFTDWVRPFAMFSNDRGAEFQDALSKRSCHTIPMYEFAGERMAEEVELLDLDVVLVLGTGYFEHAWKHLKNQDDIAAWPEPNPKFYTLKGPPTEKFLNANRRVMVLPHPATVHFKKALANLDVNLSRSESSSEFETARLRELTQGIVSVVGPAQVVDLPRNRYRRLSWSGHPSVYIQRAAESWVLKFKAEFTSELAKRWPIHSERDHRLCISVLDTAPAEEVPRLMRELVAQKILRV